MARHPMDRRLLRHKLWYGDECFFFSAVISASEHPHFSFYQTALCEISGAERRKSRELPTPLVQIGKWVGCGDRSPILSGHWPKGERRCWAAELRPGFFIYFMHNGDLLRTYDPPKAMPGGVKERMLCEEDDWDSRCVYCTNPCTKYNQASFVCCESCPHICCAKCVSTIDLHGRVALDKNEDWHCGPCRDQFEVCSHDCHACELELAVPQTPGVRFLLHCKGVGWTPATVLQYLPAGVPDEHGVVSSKNYTKVTLNRRSVWIELTKAGRCYSEDKPGVPQGVPTGGWKLA